MQLTKGVYNNMKTETRVMIENVVALICWTVIAIVFDTQWLVFFSFLFMNNVIVGYDVICDKCGKHSPAGRTFDDALKKAQKLGWNRRKAGDDWEDFCPDCQNK